MAHITPNAPPDAVAESDPLLTPTPASAPVVPSQETQPPAEPSSSPPNDTPPYSLSREHLEQEVGQVFGTLSSWWGGVKQQSVTALTSFKADLDKTVVQAQADFEQLRSAKVEIVRKDPEPTQAEGSVRSTAETSDPESFLNRLTSSTSQLQHSLQTTLQSTLAAAANNPTLANATDLTNQFAENLRLSSAKQNLQQSVKHAEKLAEGYLQKGDQLRKGAESWLSEAIKVVPPGEDSLSGSGMSWDGSDWYAIATQPGKQAVVSPLEERPQISRTSTSSRALAGSRKDALLARLREDKDLVLVDPVSAPPEQRARFERWLSTKWPGEEKDKAEEAGVAGAVRMAVGKSSVPEFMTDDEFWQRYLYIRDTIIEEDEKRQQLLQAANQQSEQDDFTWDDEPESANPAPTVVDLTEPPVVQLQPPTESQPAVMPSTTTSPRNSSEESYDVVSDAVKAEPVPRGPKAKGDDEDSDWE